MGRQLRDMKKQVERNGIFVHLKTLKKCISQPKVDRQNTFSPPPFISILNDWSLNENQIILDIVHCT